MTKAALWVARAELIAWAIGVFVGTLVLIVLQMGTKAKRRHWSVWLRTVGAAAAVGGATSAALHSHPPLGWWAFGCGILLTWFGALLLSHQDGSGAQGG